MTVDAAPDRSDPLVVPNSQHHVGLSIRGQLTVLFSDGETLDCADVKGLSAVRSAQEFTVLPDGRPQIAVTRLMTHFHSNETGLLIQQNPARPNLGILTGLRPGGAEALLPADVVFEQYLIISLRGHLYLNLDPLVMEAKAITTFPPVGNTFLSRTPTTFYDVTELEGGLYATEAGSAKPRLALASTSVCGSHVTHEIDVPTD
ncbi:hypothetical protein SAMN04488564_101115 [Lentzea waywayandensis]|uniref:Uncharacterized protein n=1 Tax=Lentzea waywayandensis TaxID=84724 RepID=A0A1I6CQT1_9PSEU|nr:hypothetical protein [Lentzea waywayandensis]SFQ95576.1 hypothetical protein SAMN04488564_101115 [Lentzea waywayandensis]